MPCNQSSLHTLSGQSPISWSLRQPFLLPAYQERLTPSGPAFRCLTMRRGIRIVSCRLRAWPRRRSGSQVRAEVPGMKNIPTYPSYSPDVMPNPPLKQYDLYFQKQFLNQGRRTVKFADETRERFAVGPARQGESQSGQGGRQSGQGAHIGMNVPSLLSASGTRYTLATGVSTRWTRLGARGAPTGHPRPQSPSTGAMTGRHRV